MFSIEELRAAGIERRDDHRADWKSRHPYRFIDAHGQPHYKSASSVALILRAYRAGRLP